jgi:hypothetical protein
MSQMPKVTDKICLKSKTTTLLQTKTKSGVLFTHLELSTLGKSRTIKEMVSAHSSTLMVANIMVIGWKVK